MRVVELIEKKRAGLALTKEEISELIQSYVEGEVPDYQMSAFAMAVCLQGMNDEETTAMTMAMAKSGDMMDLSAIRGIKVDKHSTGGVGDTTSLVLGPLLASIGVPVAKMSGRGLGHTGGTIDKLESIPGFSCQLGTNEFIVQVREIGVAIAGQTKSLAPADKSLYALRDVTGTVQSIPLIASSIMSKKLASGADAIVLDVKVGSGAFMKTKSEAYKLAKTMVAIGELAGRKTVAILSDMEQPLGYAIGNSLEVKEAIATLRGNGPTDLTELCMALGAEMAVLANVAPDTDTARQMLQDAIASGSAIDKFKRFVAAQGGNPAVADDTSLLPKAPVVHQMTAAVSGKIRKIVANECGEVAMRIGAGRSKQADIIDPSVGLVLRCKVGDFVHAGDVLVDIHAKNLSDAKRAAAELAPLIQIDNSQKEESPSESAGISSIVLGRVTYGKNDTAGDYRIDEELLQAAKDARNHAYVPYSNFAVGAALRLRDGTIVTGSNIENASFGLTNCAERTAVFSTIAAWGRDSVDIIGIAVVANSKDPVPPCGACRQVLAEFCSPDTPVLLANLADDMKQTTVGELLPGAFDKDQMSVG
jgi:pyrimidine-nucleoside phosphorylase